MLEQVLESDPNLIDYMTSSLHRLGVVHSWSEEALLHNDLVDYWEERIYRYGTNV